MDDIHQTFIDEQLEIYPNDTQKLIARTLLQNELEHLIATNPTQRENNRTQLFMEVTAQVIKQVMVMSDIIGIQPTAQSPSAVVFCRTEHKIISTIVDATAKKLKTLIPLEALQDIHHLNDPELVAHLISTLALDIASELCEEILHDLMVLSIKNPTTQKIDLVFESIHKIDKQWVDQFHEAMIQNTDSIMIASKRGHANKIITNHLGISILRSIAPLMGYKYVPQSVISVHSILHAGNLVDLGTSEIVYSVFCTASPKLSSTTEVRFLFAYKGSMVIDAGYIYVPYVTVIPSEISVNPLTFQPLMTLETKRGRWTKHFQHENELEGAQTKSTELSSDYYNLLVVPILQD